MPVKDTENKINFEEKEIQVFDMNRGANPFAGNKALSSAYRRAERIALATQLVTNSIPDTESVKGRIRTAVEDMLVHLVHMPEGFHKKESAAFTALVAKIRIVLSFLDLAHIGGFASLNNVHILKQAYLDLAQFVGASTESGNAQSVALTTEDLVTVHADKRQSESSKGQIKDTAYEQSKKDAETHTTAEQKQKRDLPLSQKRIVGSRRSAIIDTLSQRSHLNLQEISLVLPSVGQKTIQRELTKLITDGIVVREGERRWSTYSLVIE